MAARTAGENGSGPMASEWAGPSGVRRSTGVWESPSVSRPRSAGRDSSVPKSSWGVVPNRAR